MAKEVTVGLSQEQAIVLFEFLSRVTEDGNWSVEDSAEIQVLTDMLALLESTLAEPFLPNYEEILASARSETRSPAGTNAWAEKASGCLALFLEPKEITFLADEWRKIPDSSSEVIRSMWAKIAFRAMSALHKAGIEYEPVFPTKSKGGEGAA